MRMAKFVIGLGIFVSVCVLAFNYVRGHQSTAIKEELAEWKVEVQSISKEASVLKTAHSNLNGRLRQACILLRTAEIENNVCPKSDEVVEKEGEQSDG